MNLFQWRMEHGKLCDWRNWQKDAPRNEIQKHQVQKPKTGAKAKRQRPETESCIRAVGRMQLSSVCPLLPHMLRSCANDNYTQIKGEKKKLYKLYTKPYTNPTFLWFSVRYGMYSLCSKPYTNYTQNPTLKRSKPYTKGGGKPYIERYMEAFKTLHKTTRKPYTKRRAVYLGTYLSEIRRRLILTGCAPSFS